MIGITAPAWMESAACASVGGDYWFPEQGEVEKAKTAKRICATCPLAQTCLEYALKNDEQDGIWGGLTPRQRQKLAAGQATPRPRKRRIAGPLTPIKHGTHSGYTTHRDRGEDACDACKAAEAAYGREIRARRKAGAA